METALSDWEQAKGPGRPLKPFFERVKKARKSSESWKAAMKRVKKRNDSRKTRSKERKDAKKVLSKNKCSRHNPPCPSHCKNAKGKCVDKKRKSSSKKVSKKSSSKKVSKKSSSSKKVSKKSSSKKSSSKKSSSKKSSSKKSSSSKKGSKGPRFVPSPEFRGAKKGYKFTTGVKGTGYYKDSTKRVSSKKKSAPKNKCLGHKPPCPNKCIARGGKCVTVEQWLK